MDFGVRRRVWLTEVVVMMVAAGFAGDAVWSLIASRQPLRVEPLPPRARRPHPAAAETGKAIDFIIGRNVFCSACGDGPAPEPSHRALTLLAIMYAPPPSDARWSVAVIRDEETSMAGPYGLGGQLQGATIVEIEDVRVVLDVGGTLEFLELLSRPPWHAPESGSEVLAGGVRQTGARRYVILGRELDRFLSGDVPAAFPRVVPYAREGAPAGLRLTGVDRAGVFAAIGLEEGDVLLEVNGRSIASPDWALAAYAALRAEDHISLTLLRGRERMRMDYVIR
jgi:type II secretory pathway component PulC